MVKIYVKLIKNGKINASAGEPWKIADVPERWREAVKNIFESEI